MNEYTNRKLLRAGIATTYIFPFPNELWKPFSSLPGPHSSRHQYLCFPHQYIVFLCQSIAFIPLIISSLIARAYSATCQAFTKHMFFNFLLKKKKTHNTSAFEMYVLPLNQISLIKNTIGYCQVAKSILKT